MNPIMAVKTANDLALSKNYRFAIDIYENLIKKSIVSIDSDF